MDFYSSILAPIGYNALPTTGERGSRIFANKYGVRCGDLGSDAERDSGLCGVLGQVMTAMVRTRDAATGCSVGFVCHYSEGTVLNPLEQVCQNVRQTQGN